MPEQIHKLLARQLRKAGHRSWQDPPSKEVWDAVLKTLSDHYVGAEEDRRLLEGSLERSTREMEQVNDRLRRERERLRSVVKVLSRTLATFRDAVSSCVRQGSFEEASGAVTQARDRFSAEIDELVADLDDSAALDDVGRELSTLADHLHQLMKSSAADASMREGLQLAGAVQQLLLPDQEVLTRPFVQVAGHSRSADLCGGDWWTAVDLKDGRVLLVVGDVTGHGAGSAILTGVAKGAVDLSLRVYGNNMSSALLLNLMNVAIRAAGRQQFLMTATAMIFDPNSSSVSLANAGHAFPLLARSSGEETEIQTLVAHGPPLGASDTAAYSEVDIGLTRGDTVLAYTDGVTERQNRRGEQFGERRLRALLQHGATWNAVPIRDSIVHGLSRHAGDVPPEDDTTLIIAKMA